MKKSRFLREKLSKTIIMLTAFGRRKESGIFIEVFFALLSNICYHLPFGVQIAEENKLDLLT